jgi:enterochelin esterase-like enzyme
MKKKLILSIFCLFIFLGSHAQELANMRPKPVISPEITDKEVFFRISAPYADTVKLYGSWMTNFKSAVLLIKDKAGIWSVAITAPTPELYTYSFIVDGLNVNDANNIFMQRDGTRYLSVLLVPGALTANYFEAKHRGNLSKVWYDSPVLGMNRRMFVYTPYGYESKTATYPVLYLLHGYGGDEDAWSTMGRACQIMDNLIEKKLARPMLVVMTNGNGNESGSRNDIAIDANRGSTLTTMVKFEESILKDVIPYIENNYMVYTDRNHRAIAGLSMGGAQATHVGLNHLDKFAWVGSFSGAFVLWPDAREGDQNINLKVVESQVFPTLNSSSNSKLKLLYISTGADDFLIKATHQFNGWLKDKGVKFVNVETPGYAHEWRFWRISLSDFTSRLFK